MPPITNSESEGRAEINTSDRSGDRVNEDDATPSTQARMLLVALRNVIVPLVQTALPNQKVNLDHASFGPEAEDFLVALQKYIVSIVQDRSQSDRKAEVKEAATPEELPMAPKTQEEQTHDKDAKGHHESSSSDGSEVKRIVNLEGKKSSIPRILHGEEMRFSPPATLPEIALNQVLTSLQAHVFNTMPIRLLCFESHGSSLEVTLLDRTGIYSHLASKLQDRFFESNMVGLELDQAVEIAIEYIPKISTYSILSHTWSHSSPGEVTFGDWYRGVFNMTHPGYQKLINFCRVSAEEHEVTLGWMDTVCINKESSAELDESIRSMFKWYQNAKNCIIYLAETTILSDMASDPWFTRGWTLQELLAPKYITFYGADWMNLGNGLFNDKEDRNVQEQITLATTITAADLLSPLSDAPISRKMRWAATRKVTRGEDTAYSLMGIFNISISTAYGEGATLAFIRLAKEILNTTKGSEVVDLLIWGGNYATDISALIPSSPAAYIGRSEFNFGRMRLRIPLELKHWGLHTPILLIPAAPHRPGMPYTPRGDYSSTVNINPVLDEDASLRGFFNILGHLFFASPFSHEGEPLGLAFAVLNSGAMDRSSIVLYRHCHAVAILYTHQDGVYKIMGNHRRVLTKDPICFQLNHWRQTSQDDWEYDIVQKSELKGHGMYLFDLNF